MNCTNWWYVLHERQNKQQVRDLCELRNKDKNKQNKPLMTNLFGTVLFSMQA